MGVRNYCNAKVDINVPSHITRAHSLFKINIFRGNIHARQRVEPPTDKSRVQRTIQTFLIIRINVQMCVDEC